MPRESHPATQVGIHAPEQSRIYAFMHSCLRPTKQTLGVD